MEHSKYFVSRIKHKYGYYSMLQLLFELQLIFDFLLLIYLDIQLKSSSRYIIDVSIRNKSRLINNLTGDKHFKINHLCNLIFFY